MGIDQKSRVDKGLKMTLGRPSQAQLKKRLQAALKRNKSCADCGEKRPTWVSILKPQEAMPVGSGILVACLCFNCAACHRKLGAHIDKVLSVSLNDFQENEIEAAENSGNHVVNAIYEQPGAEKIKPHSGAPLATKESFVKQKYESLVFYSKHAHYDHLNNLKNPSPTVRSPLKKLGAFFDSNSSFVTKMAGSKSVCSTTWDSSCGDDKSCLSAPMLAERNLTETTVPLKERETTSESNLDGFLKRGKRPTKAKNASRLVSSNSKEIPSSSGHGILQKQAPVHSDPRRSAFQNSRSGLDVSPEELMSGDEEQPKRQKPILVSSMHNSQAKKSTLYSRSRSTSRSRARSSSRSRDSSRSTSRPRTRNSSSGRPGRRRRSKSANKDSDKRAGVSHRTRERSASRTRTVDMSESRIRNTTRSPRQALICQPRRSKSEDLSAMVSSLFDESFQLSSSDLADLMQGRSRSRSRSRGRGRSRDSTQTDDRQRSKSSGTGSRSRGRDCCRDLAQIDSNHNCKSRRSRSRGRRSSMELVQTDSDKGTTPRDRSRSRGRGSSRELIMTPTQSRKQSPSSLRGRQQGNSKKNETRQTDVDESCFHVVASASLSGLKGSNHSWDGTSFRKPYVKPSIKKGGEGTIKDARRLSHTKRSQQHEERQARKMLLAASLDQQESNVPLKHKANLSPKKSSAPGRLVIRAAPQRTKSLDGDQIIRPRLDVEFGNGKNNTDLLQTYHERAIDTTKKLSRLDEQTRIQL